ncbi:hypothetical protein B566_EDAN010978 [Ephemera danica]|nr:hypothetical protein B566_EDAN010978 [Ephemera danica]
MDRKNGIEAMRVEESITCAKMTEERSKNGVSEISSSKTKSIGSVGDTVSVAANGALSPKSTLSTEGADCQRSAGGGRLKFFKDGKLIIELSHRKEGERTSWIQVPKKTFWPPAGGGGALLSAAPVAGTSRQESSASLSVSDDNSSVQSSPWQRDHCWKQQTPRKDLGRELTFVMKPSLRMRCARHSARPAVQKKRRRPIDPIEIVWEDMENLPNSPKLRTRNIRHCEGKLNSTIERLFNLAIEASSNCSRQVVQSCTKIDPNIISPRKRILREFERVSLEDLASKRHKRPSALVKSPSPPIVPGCSNINSNNNINNNNNGSNIRPTAVKTKGNYNVPSSTPSPPSFACSNTVVSNSSGKSNKVSEKLGSYSINSLLGKCDSISDSVVPSEQSFLRSLLKSPSRSSGGCDLASVAGGSSPSSMVHSPQPCQSPPDIKWSRPHKKKVSSSPDTQSSSSSVLRLATNPSPAPPTVPSHHLSPPHFLSHPHPHHMYPGLSFLPHQPPLIPSHYYAPYPSRSPLWPPHPAAAVNLSYPHMLPTPWSHLPLGPPSSPQQPLLVEPGKREELTADMPLNLSKNAG